MWAGEPQNIAAEVQGGEQQLKDGLQQVCEAKEDLLGGLHELLYFIIIFNIALRI